MRIDNQIIVKAEASGGSHPAIVATVPLTATASKAVLASSFMSYQCVGGLPKSSALASGAFSGFFFSGFESDEVPSSFISPFSI